MEVYKPVLSAAFRGSENSITGPESISTTERGIKAKNPGRYET